VQITVNGTFVNERATNGVWWAGPETLMAGTNAWTVVARDRAGWTTSNTVWVVYDPQLATNLPVVTVALTNQVVVTGSNTTSLALNGTVDDDNALVQVLLLDPLAATITNAVLTAAVQNQQWWVDAPLTLGSNVVVITAQNGGSAVVTNALTIVRDATMELAITNPAPYSTANATNIVVSGVASTNFNGSITINGSLAIVSGSSSGVVFQGSLPI
jgi:hypothetical protein